MKKEKQQESNDLKLKIFPQFRKKNNWKFHQKQICAAAAIKSRNRNWNERKRKKKKNGLEEAFSGAQTQELN